MGELKARLLNRVQLSADGMGGYPKAVAKHFGQDIDFAVVIKEFMPPPNTPEAKRRYSPNKVIGTTIAVYAGNPDKKLASISHNERANLSMRMGNAPLHSADERVLQEIENHMHAISFYFIVYNFVKVPGSIKTTPAIAARVTSIKWTMEDIVNIADTVTFDQAD